MEEELTPIRSNELMPEIIKLLHLPDQRYERIVLTLERYGPARIETHVVATKGRK